MLRTRWQIELQILKNSTGLWVAAYDMTYRTWVIIIILSKNQFSYLDEYVSFKISKTERGYGCMCSMKTLYTRKVSRKNIFEIALALGRKHA